MRGSVRRILGILGSAAALLAVWMSAPPAANAAATVTVTLDCASSPSFFASPGDTIVLTFAPGCNYVTGPQSNRLWNLWNVNNGYQTNTGSGFLDYVTRSSYTTVDNGAGFSQYTGQANYASDWYVAAPTTGSATVTTTLRSVDGSGTALQPGSTVAVVNNEYWLGVPTPRSFNIVWLGSTPPSSVGGAIPTAAMQAFAIGAGADCGRLAPAEVNWPGLQGQQSVGWQQSWQQWAHGGRGGLVCWRQPVFDGSRWMVP